jgi:hypothetical protein
MAEVVPIGDTNRKQKIKVILALAVPTMIENLLLTIVGFVDTLFVSTIGLNEVAAVGVANALVAVYIAVFMAMGIGTSSLIARCVGAGDIVKAKAIARQSTWISAITGLLFGIITLFFAEPILRLMGTEPHVLANGVVYEGRNLGQPDSYRPRLCTDLWCRRLGGLGNRWSRLGNHDRSDRRDGENSAGQCYRSSHSLGLFII